MDEDEQFSIEPMTEKDLPQVCEIEQKTFSMPWSLQLWSEEMAKSQMKHYLVARSKDTNDVVGYAGFWLVADEANITNIAVKQECRRKKIGERLLDSLLKMAVEKGAHLATLDVRESNLAAKSLYQKFGFKHLAIRKKYYTDNGEDAWVFWKNPLA